jgi:transposase
MGRYELTEFEWKTIRPLLPNKPRGMPRVDDRRVLNGIFWILRSGSPWADLPERYGPPTTVYNRFNRWRKAGVWDRLMDAIIAAHDGKVQMIDSSVVCPLCAKRRPSAVHVGIRFGFFSRSRLIAVALRQTTSHRSIPAPRTRLVHGGPYFSNG